MKCRFISTEFPYDGSQLRSLFAYLDHGLMGDSIVSWVGACSIANENMVDGEDLLAGATISGHRMVHFVVEKFNTSLVNAVILQRLFASICLDLLREGTADPRTTALLRRDGDDLYFGSGKLSISIATVSPLSALIHFAVNVTNEGTPVRTASLEDLGWTAEDFAHKAMKRLVDEVASMDAAVTKVRWVR